jgi:hypothetical protein
MAHTFRGGGGGRAGVCVKRRARAGGGGGVVGAGQGAALRGCSDATQGCAAAASPPTSSLIGPRRPIRGGAAAGAGCGSMGAGPHLALGRLELLGHLRGLLVVGQVALLCAPGEGGRRGGLAGAHEPAAWAGSRERDRQRHVAAGCMGCPRAGCGPQRWAAAQGAAHLQRTRAPARCLRARTGSGTPAGPAARACARP